MLIEKVDVILLGCLINTQDDEERITFLAKILFILQHNLLPARYT